MKMFKLISVLVVAVLLSAGQLSPSVVQGTLIATVQGEKHVEDLRVGDEIVGFDTSTQVIVKSRVTAISSRSSNSAVVLTTTKEEVIPAAPDQQFFDPVAQEWILASDFALSNHLLDSMGNQVSCREVMRCNANEEMCTVYDISTTAPHTFFVTKSQFLTHNILPVAIGISFAFDSLFALGTWAFSSAAVSFGALVVGTAGLGLHHAQAVRDLETCFKNPLNNEDTQKHVLQSKHKWPELVPDPKKNWDEVVKIITTVMATGASRPEGKTADVFIKSANISNRIVEVKYFVDKGVEIISNAWVK